MSKEFDKYLQQANLSQDQKDVLSQAKEEGLDKHQSPGDVQNSYTPHSKDAGKHDRAGQEATLEETGKTLKEQGLEAEQGMLANYSISREPSLDQEKENEQEMER